MAGVVPPAALTAPAPTGSPSGPEVVVVNRFLRITISTRRFFGLPALRLFAAIGLRGP